MKTWLMALPLLCAAGMAMAQGAEGSGAALQESAATQEQVRAQTQERTQASKPRPAKGGDIRQCLDRKSNKEIHRCAAPKRGK